MRKLRKQLLCVPHSWVQGLAWVLPSPVEVAACQAAYVVAIDNTIRIKHRNDLKHELISELYCLGIAADQEINHSFHHP